MFTSKFFDIRRVSFFGKLFLYKLFALLIHSPNFANREAVNLRCGPDFPFPVRRQKNP